MKQATLNKFLLLLILTIFGKNTFASAPASSIRHPLIKTDNMSMVDTIPGNSKTQTDKGNNNKNRVFEVKEVPKAKHQPKPEVVAPKIKIKPVKIIKPKINAKGLK